MRIAYLRRMLKRLEGEDERLHQLASAQGLTEDAEKALIQQLEKSREEVISELRSLESEIKS